MVGCFLKLLD
ncbi:Protein of unknown function [Bacillus wiedmannii]|nr:Protein of unknown function [Bacillus wiedmannii]SCN05296.1 Protein of unknown function [Bacillus wiedmannii]